MLSALVKLLEDAAGLERTLRLCQYVSQTGAAVSLASAEGWKQAQSQFALSRRFFRLLKWYGCWSFAYQSFYGDYSSAERMLRVAKWSFLGFYFFFEMFTITNAMKITSYDWSPAMQREALKFWLYGIVSSIFLSIYQISLGFFCDSDIRNDGGEKRGDGKKATSAQSKIYVQLVIDCADVLIPAALLGWLSVDEFYVGIAGTTSSVLAGQDILNRVQAYSLTV